MNAITRSSPTFTEKYYLGIDEKKGDKSVVIQMTGKVPVSYRVIVGEEVWDIPRGRENVWIVLVAFLWIVRERGGYIGFVNLASRGIGLIE